MSKKNPHTHTPAVTDIFNAAHMHSQEVFRLLLDDIATLSAEMAIKANYDPDDLETNIPSIAEHAITADLTTKLKTQYHLSAKDFAELGRTFTLLFESYLHEHDKQQTIDFIERQKIIFDQIAILNPAYGSLCKSHIRRLQEKQKDYNKPALSLIDENGNFDLGQLWTQPDETNHAKKLMEQINNALPNLRRDNE